MRYSVFLVVCRSTQEAEGTPLERVQVVNSGARVQIPPSAVTFCIKCAELVAQSTLTNKQQCNPERFLLNEMKGSSHLEEIQRTKP